MGLFQRIFESLNAPFGARCFLTLGELNAHGADEETVLMHFWRSVLSDGGVARVDADILLGVLMHLLALGAF